MMANAEWIIVRADDHRPHLLGSNPSPFRYYAEGSDPNASGAAIDNGILLTYLPVIRPGEPMVDNPVLERTEPQSTQGDDGKMYPGAFSSPNWVIGWDVLPQYLDAARQKKIAKLEEARAIRVNQGYELNGGGFPVPLTEEMGARLAYEAQMFKAALSMGAVDALTDIQIWQANGTPIVLGQEQIEEHSVAFWIARRQMNSVYMAAYSAINSASTPELVDAVIWTF